jgi:hypothetical protein
MIVFSTPSPEGRHVHTRKVFGLSVFMSQVPQLRLQRLCAVIWQTVGPDERNRVIGRKYFEQPFHG